VGIIQRIMSLQMERNEAITGVSGTLTYYSYLTLFYIVVSIPMYCLARTYAANVPTNGVCGHDLRSAIQFQSHS
jgi:hypothetical protein